MTLQAITTYILFTFGYTKKLKWLAINVKIKWKLIVLTDSWHQGPKVEPSETGDPEYHSLQKREDSIVYEIFDLLNKELDVKSPPATVSIHSGCEKNPNNIIYLLITQMMYSITIMTFLT